MSEFHIMFVCLGNICRSPVAQAVLEYQIREESLEDHISVESSGTDTYHIGEQADSRMRQTAGSHGVRINHHSRKFRREDLNDYHLILAMDQRNLREVERMCTSESEKRKIRLFRDYDPQGSGDVPDPWYGGPEGFDEVWHIVERTCGAILKEIRSIMSI